MNIKHECCDDAIYGLATSRGKWFMLTDYGDILITHCPWCGERLPHVEPEPIIEQKPICPHKNCELRGHTRPDNLPENAFWLNDPSLICLDCGTHLMYIPSDVTCIKNIPHPPREECDHPKNMIVYPFGWGPLVCLQCGEGLPRPIPESLLVISKSTNAAGNI